jgi:short-subunit dehydrogenase
MQLTRGMTALITGASSGIGEAFSQALAARGINLVLVARSEQRLATLAARLREQHGVQTTVLASDLAVPTVVETIAQAVEQRGLGIDLLVNNAGFATQGHFEAIPTERDREQIGVDVAAVVALTHAFAPAMLARRYGAIINVASMAAFLPTPYMAVYGASKAFVLSFSQALAEEFGQQGVQVLALCPGATDTGFFSVAGDVPGAERRRTPQQVVDTALRALAHNRTVVVDGRANAMLAPLLHALPSRLATRSLGARARAHEQAIKHRG